MPTRGEEGGEEGPGNTGNEAPGDLAVRGSRETMETTAGRRAMRATVPAAMTATATEMAAEIGGDGGGDGSDRVTQEGEAMRSARGGGVRSGYC